MADQQALARALLQKLERYSEYLEELFAKVVKKLGNQIKASKRFFDLLVENAKKIAEVVNPVGAVVKSVQFIYQIFDALKNRLRLLRKVLAKVIGLLQRGMNNLPGIMGQVTKLMKRFVKGFRELLSDIMQLADESRTVEKVLGLIARMKRVLQAMFDWIDGVSGASTAVRKVAKVLKKMVKQARLMLRELKTMPKEVRALAKAA